MNPLVEAFLDRKTDLLSVSEEPVDGAVAIPLRELPSRTYELPSRGDAVRVVDTGLEAAKAVEWLRSTGRIAKLEPYRSALLRGAGPPLLAPSSSRLRRQEEGILWSPNPFLMEVLPELDPGRAIDIACGAGREAVALACCGWEATGVDILPDSLDRARLLERRYSTGAPVEWVRADIERDEPDASFDLYVIFRFLDRELISRIAARIKPGASLVMETFTTLHRERHGRPSSDRHVLEPGELPGLVRGLKVERYEEGWRGDVHAARVWARSSG